VIPASNTTTPKHPIEAVTHHNPAPYNTTLADGPPMFDDTLQMWVVGSARDADAALIHPAARVRPAGQPWPADLGDGAAANTFQRIARMNDGAEHATIRRMIDAWFAALTPDQINEACRAGLTDVPDSSDHRSMIEAWMRVYPCAVMVRLMGLDAENIPALVTAAEALAAAFGPGAGPETVGPADAAILTITDALDEPRKPLANSVAGFLFQTFDATAALIGNSLLHLDATRDHRAVDRAIQYALRNDLPIQNTRRFTHEDMKLGDTTIAPGETILVVLASAALQDEADESRAFGAGVHRCPAHTLAPAICKAAVTELIQRLDGAAMPTPTGYRLRQNARIPEFATKETTT
jgi:cytochrome P450